MTDSSAALSSGELPDHVPVDCGTLHRVLFHHRLENGRSLCITVGKSKDFISPCEFERRGGKTATHNWKKSIQYKQQPIGDFLQDCVSSTTGKRCCRFVLSSIVSPPVACLASRGSPVSASPTGRPPASSSTRIFIPSSSVSVHSDSASLLNSDSLPVAPSSVYIPSASPNPNGSPGGMSCVLCGKAVKTVAALWQHINSVHISRGCFPPLTFFQHFDCFICSNSSCRFPYSIRWSTCQRSLGGSHKCGARLIDPSSLPDLIPSTLAPPCVASCSGPTNSSGSGPANSLSVTLSVCDLSTKEMISIAIQAAVDCQISTEYRQFDTQIFDTFMTTLFCLPVHTVRHVPRMVRPLLASTLCHEFSLSVNHGLWGFARVLIFPKLVLRSPPSAGHKKRYVVGPLLRDRLQQWTSDTGIPDLWHAVCEEGVKCDPSATRSGLSASNELAKSNVRRAFRWTSEGRYGNALRALGSLGVAFFNDTSAREELLRHHPHSELPSPSSSVPAPLTVQPSLVLLALRSFQRGTSPGSSALRPQHLLDTICGSTAPAAVECLHSLIHCINGLLTGTLDSRLAPWFCGAPLTVLVKKGGGFRPITVGKTLHRLVSKVCCFSVRLSLPDLLLPFGQVGVGISGGLEAYVHSLRTILSTLGSDSSLCCLKLDMTNAFNECSRISFFVSLSF